MAENFKQLLGQVINKHGSSVCDTPSLLNSLLADYSCGEHRKGRRLLVWILETGCVNTLTPEKDYETWQKECAATLNSEYYIDSDKAMSMLGIIYDILLRETYLQNRANYLFQSNEYEKADRIYSDILNNNPSSVVALLGKGNIAVKKQNYDDVIKYFEKLSKIDPLKKGIVGKDLGIAYLNKGNSAKDEQKYQEAIDNLTKAIFYDAESRAKVELVLAEIYYLQANSEFGGKNYSAAISYILDAVQYLHNNKIHLDSLLNKASVNDLFDFYNAVINYSALQVSQREYLYSSLSKIFLSKGNIAIENQSWNQAIRCYETIIELDPQKKAVLTKDLGIAYFNKGNQAKDEQKYQVAIDCFTKAIFYDAESRAKVELVLAEIYYLQANSEFDAKNYTAANNAFTSAMQYTHDNKMQVALLLKRAETNELLENYTKAISDYDKALTIDSNDIHIYEKRSHLYFKSGNYDAALRDCETIIKLDSHNISAMYHKGIILEKQGKIFKAKDVLEESLQLNPEPTLRAKIDVCLCEINTKVADYHESCGDKYFVSKEYLNAYHEYSIAIAAIPSNGKLFMKRGDVSKLLDNNENTINDYKKAFIFNLDTDIVKSIFEKICPNTDKVRRQAWEDDNTYLPFTTFPFKCSNCINYNIDTSSCSLMKMKGVFALTPMNARCHGYKKIPGIILDK